MIGRDDLRWLDRLQDYFDQTPHDIDEQVDRLFIDKTLETKKDLISKRQHRTPSKPRPKLSWSKIILPLISLALVFGLLLTTLPVFYGGGDFDIGVSIEPIDPVEGDIIYFNATIPASYNITDAWANISGIETINLTVVANTTIDNHIATRLWQGTWLFHNLSAGDHLITLSAVDYNQTFYQTTYRWTIASNVSGNESEETPEGNVTQNDTTQPDNNQTQNDTTPPIDDGYTNDTQPPTNVSDDTITAPTDLIVNPQQEQRYILPGASFYVERTISTAEDAETIFAPLYSDGLALEKIEIIGANATQETVRSVATATLFSKDVSFANTIQTQATTLVNNLGAKADGLNRGVYTSLQPQQEPVTVRTWFTAPSFEEIQDGLAPSSGRISYLLFNRDNVSTYDFEGSTWWNSNWNYRKLITVNSSQVDADMVNFPILVSTTDTDLRDKAQDDGDDIAFVLFSDNTTKLNHEIEDFNGTTGKLVCWVNITRLESSADTKIWMYYNNSAASNQQNVAGTWNANYVVVQHLNETSGTYYDSTAYGNNGTLTDADSDSTRGTTGKTGPGIDFNGDADFINCGQDTSLDVDYVTIEAWAKFDVNTGKRVIASIDDGSNRRFCMYLLDENPYKLRFFVFVSNSWSSPDEPFQPTTGIWYHLAGVKTSSDVITYRNGTILGTPAARAGVMDKDPMDLRIGCGSYPGYFDGTIDEFRMSNIARNSSWILTSYNTMNNPTTFISFESEETALPQLTNPVPSNGATGTEIPPSSFNITVSDANGDTMNITWRTNESGSWTTFNTSTNVGNGTYNATNTSWVDSYVTTYWWSANVTDGNGWANATYRFTTRPENFAPVIANIYPTNASIQIPLKPECQIWANDSDGDNLDIYWYENSSGGGWALRNTNSSVTANTTVSYNFSQFNTDKTTYWWKVAVNDSEHNTSAWYSFTTRSNDTTKPSSSVTAISPYWHNAGDNPLTLTSTDAQDDPGGDGLKNVSLYYYYSSDNSSWSGPWFFSVDSDPWVTCSWSFTFPNSSGYYRFYSRAADNASPVNTEDPPVANDTSCGYDAVAPTSSINDISPYVVTSSPLTLSGSASDALSGMNNVSLWYRYSSDNVSWGGIGDWFNSSWTYRKKHHIDGTSAGDQTNYTLHLIVHYGNGTDSGKHVYLNNKCKTDFGDIRFTASDKVTELGYYLEEKTDSTKASFWIKLPELNETNGEDIYIYYGNAGASTTSNGDNAFLLWEDFEAVTNIFDTHSSGSVGRDGSNAKEGSYAGIPAAASYNCHWNSTYTYSRESYYIEAWMKWVDSTIPIGLHFQGQDSGTDGYQIIVEGRTADNPEIRRNINSGDATKGTYLPTQDVYYFYRGWMTSTTIEARLFDDTYETNQYGGNTSRTDNTYTGTGYVGVFNYNNQEGYVDAWRIRARANPEPSDGTWYTEEDYSSVGWEEWSNASNPDTAAPWNWTFTFPNGTGYYEFYSIAADVAGNTESSPSSPDALCEYNTSLSINVTPDQWAMGSVNIGDTNETSGWYFNLSNEGNVALDITINATYATNSTTGAQWNLTSPPAKDNFSLWYKKNGDGSWTNITTSFTSFVTNLAADNWKTFDLKLLMATTSSTTDPLGLTVTFKAVVA